MEVNAAPVGTDKRMRPRRRHIHRPLDRPEHGEEVAGLGWHVGEGIVGQPHVEVKVGVSVSGTATEGTGVEHAEDRRVFQDGRFEPVEEGANRGIEHAYPFACWAALPKGRRSDSPSAIPSPTDY